MDPEIDAQRSAILKLRFALFFLVVAAIAWSPLRTSGNGSKWWVLLIGSLLLIGIGIVAALMAVRYRRIRKIQRGRNP
jgi:hypothetical protein